MQYFARDSRNKDMKDAFQEKIMKGEDVTMCSLLDYAENKGVAEGMEKGMEKGVQALIEAGLEFGQSYDSTMRVLMDKLSVDAVTAREKMDRYWKGTV